MNAQFIGYYTIEGPTGYIEAQQKEDLECFVEKLIRSWPKTITKSPYKNWKGIWIVKVKTR